MKTEEGAGDSFPDQFVTSSVTPEEKRQFLSSLRFPNKDAVTADELVEKELMNLKGTPIITKISKLNGAVNLLPLNQLQSNLREIGLEETGSEESCRRRLKFHLRNEAVSRVTNKLIMNNYCYDVICVVDFEATCEDNQNSKGMDVTQAEALASVPSSQEIIEFPVFFVDVKKREIVSTFHSFVKPSKTSNLSSFCTELTGITQRQVDSAQSFSQVIEAFEDWLYFHLKNYSYTSFAFATDGSWDFAHFFANSCQVNGIPYPSYAKRWINIRKVFSSHYKLHSVSLAHMLSHLGMDFEGRKHSGFDDTKNIARVLIRMLVDGANPVINERISWHSVERSSWFGMRAGVVRVFYNKPSDGLNLSDSEDDAGDDDEEKRKSFPGSVSDAVVASS